MTDFEAFWRVYFPETLPLGYILRERLNERWVRFHSLPQSKQYAENDDERSVILHRANTIAASILGEKEPCWLVTCRYDDAKTSALLESDPSFELDYAFQHIEREPGELDDIVFTFYSATTRWRANKFDPVVTAIAEEREQNLWVSSHNPTVFAPYDGGFDLIMPTREEASILQEQFKDWKSVHPSGL